MLITPVLHGVPVPLAWHMTPEEVRHRLGSPKTIKLAPADAPPVVGKSSALLPDFAAELLYASGAFGGIREASPAPKSHQNREDYRGREAIYAALRKHPEGQTRAELVAATGLGVQRVIALTREDEERAALVRFLQGAGRPILLKLAPPWPKPERA